MAAFAYRLSQTITAFVFAMGALLATPIQAENCPAGQFQCNVDEPYSTTCCQANQICGVSNQGKAQCAIPAESNRKPAKANSKPAKLSSAPTKATSETSKR